MTRQQYSVRHRETSFELHIAAPLNASYCGRKAMHNIRASQAIPRQ